MALPPITPPGSPMIQPLTGGNLNHGLLTPPQTPPQTPQQGGVVDFGKVSPLSLSDKKVQEPAHHEENHEGGFKGALDEVADKTSLIPGFSAVVGGVADSEGGVGGALKGAAGGVMDVTENNIKSLKDFPTSPTQLVTGAYKENVKNSERAPDWATKLAGKES